MSGYSVPYSAPDSYELPLPVPIDSSWRPTLPPPPPASREQNLAQPFDQWSFRPPLDLPGPSYAANGIGQQGLPPQQPLRPQQLPASNNSGWGNGGLLHVSATIPDEMLPKQFAAGSELVKVTGKSCSTCRTRKVKCDRRYPECTRCVKRRERCEYGDDVSFALRPLALLNRPRETDSPDSSVPSPRAINVGEHSTNHPQHRLPPTSLAVPYPPPRTTSEIELTAARSLRTVSDFRHQLARKGVTQYQSQQSGEEREEDRQPGFQQLWDRFLDQSNLGESSSDWRLALPAMASSLTIHLLDASMNSCCYHLPAFHIFNPFIAYYKQNLKSLDVASQAVVGILASLGARASPHSALLGVAGPDIENGNASHELVLSAGVRRENAWRAIVKQAKELCSKLEVLQVPSAMNAQTLTAFVQMIMFAEVKPKTARFFLRAALGLFYDMQGGDLSEDEVKHIKQTVGTPLYESDARISAWLNLPALISENDLNEYFDGTGVHLVDLEREHLLDQLSALFDDARGPMTSEKAEEALRITGFYVCAVQRLFAKVSSNRRASPTRYLASIEHLWGYIDGAHAACQLLTGTLREFAMAQNDLHHSAHHDLLIGLRMHERLLDIMNLSNEWLRSKRNDNLSTQDRTALESFLGNSNRRVRRCLKVLAFYAKVFHDSHDKHVVYHLFTQLEAVEGWATMAAQGEDEVDEFGPLGSQCVLTETELDYFSQALQLACFYTPLSAQRLEEFTRARQMRNHRAPNFAQLPSYNPLPFDPLLDTSHDATTSTHPLSPSHQPFQDPALSRDLSFDADSNSIFGTAQAEALTNWVLSGFAGVDSSNATLVDSDSPSTTSHSISPGDVIDQGSSPDSNPPLTGKTQVPPPPPSSEYISHRAPQNPAQENSRNHSAIDVSFPSSTHTNLAQHSVSNYHSPVGANRGLSNGNSSLVFPNNNYRQSSVKPNGRAVEEFQWSL